MRILATLAVLLLLSGCASSIESVDARVIASFDFAYDRRRPPSFTVGEGDEYVMAVPGSNDFLTVTALDATLVPKWSRGHWLDAYETPSILALDATDDAVITTVTDADREAEPQLVLMRRAMTDGAFIDSIRIAGAPRRTTGGDEGGFQSLRRLDERRRCFVRTHYGWWEQARMFDSVHLEIVMVDFATMRFETRWCSMSLPPGFRDLEEVKRWGLTALQRGDDGHIYGASFARDSTIIVHDVDPSTGFDDPVSFRHERFDPRAEHWATLSATITRPDNRMIDVAIAVNPATRDLDDFAPTVLLARLNARKGFVERAAVQEFQPVGAYSPHIIMAGHHDRLPFAFVGLMNTGRSLFEDATPSMLGRMFLFDTTYTIRRTDGFTEYLGAAGPTMLMTGDKIVALLYREGATANLGSRFYSLRLYDAGKGELSSAQTLVNTRMEVLPGSLWTLSSGEIVMTLGDGILGTVVRMQPRGAHRLAPLLVP